jgi:hypothetical protein
MTVKRPRPRLALKLAACALAGAVMTVAVAWGCAVWAPVQSSFRTDGSWPWPRAVPVGWPAKAHRFAHALPGMLSADQYWTTSTDVGEAASHIWGVSIYRMGWPWHSMTYEVFASTPAASVHDWDVAAIEVPRRIHRRKYARRFLPYRLLWPGFALNTAFYGAIVSALWSAPALIRRRVRKHRGHCPTCNYDLRGSTGGTDPCPECGSLTSRPSA